MNFYSSRTQSRLNRLAAKACKTRRTFNRSGFRVAFFSEFDIVKKQFQTPALPLTEETKKCQGNGQSQATERLACGPWRIEPPLLLSSFR
jgi:hypothetical protein